MIIDTLSGFFNQSIIPGDYYFSGLGLYGIESDIIESSPEFACFHEQWPQKRFDCSSPMFATKKPFTEQHDLLMIYLYLEPKPK